MTDEDEAAPEPGRDSMTENEEEEVRAMNRGGGEGKMEKNNKDDREEEMGRNASAAISI
jgi:hypothetical protein